MTEINPNIEKIDSISSKRQMAHTNQEFLRDKTLSEIKGLPARGDDADERMKELDDERTSVTRGLYQEQINQEDRFYGNQINERNQELLALEHRKNTPHTSDSETIPDLGEDLESMRADPDVGIDYEFDQKNDRRNVLARTAVNKFKGAKNYVQKHPVKTAAKLLPGATLAMNAFGTGKSIQRSRDAGKEQDAADTEAQQLMWGAHKKKNTKNAIRKGVSTVVGATTIGFGGGFDFGTGETAGHIGESAIEALGPIISGGIEDSSSLVGSEMAEMAVEDPLGNMAEDGVSNLRDATKSSSLLKTSRKARMELMKPGGGDANLAHKSLLAKDIKYGNAVRSSVRSTLNDKQGPAFFEKKRERNLGRGEIQPGRENITAKANLLSQLKETAAKQRSPDTTGEGVSSEETLNVGKAKVDQHQTSAARNLRLQKQFGYHDGKLGHTPMSVTGAQLKDEKIDGFGKKSRFES